MDIKKYKIKHNEKIIIKNFKTDDTGKYSSKEDVKSLIEENLAKMNELQDKLYAGSKYSILIIFQAMDAAGKDGAIKHVMNGLNPQGTQVYNFKQPSVEELKHGYLWRISKSLPERGKIGVFNRSHFEEVLVVRVHNLIYKQNIPGELINKNIWQDRFSQIRAFENYLFKNGYVILKFYLHISKEEQKKRFLKRLEEPEKNWKFSIADYKEREYWQDYQKCYEEAISATSTKYSPWYIIPSDAKWYSRYLISKIIVDTMVNLKLEYPRISKNDLNIFKEYKDKLLKEK